MKRVFHEVRDNALYTGPDNQTIGREYGKTPNGNGLNGAWVLRGGNGEWLDFDRYINDLAERNDIKLEREE